MNKWKYDIAFIVPSYNIENYIGEAIESILRQTKVKCQIIIVNDGSKDNTLSVSRRYANSHGNISVIDKKNEGVSIARNIGIKFASAEYVCFMDGDDFYLEDFAFDFLNKCRDNHLDIIRGRYRLIEDRKNKGVYPLSIIDESKVFTGLDFLHNSIKLHTNEVVPWLGFYRLDFLKDNKLFFPDYISFTEDQLFFLQTLLIPSCRIMEVDKCFYGYRIREGSAVTSSYSQKKVNDIFHITKEEYKIAENNQLNEDILRFTSATLSQIFSFYKKGNKVERQYIIDALHQLPILTLARYCYSNKIRLKLLIAYFCPFLLELKY